MWTEQTAFSILLNAEITAEMEPVLYILRWNDITAWRAAIFYSFIVSFNTLIQSRRWKENIELTPTIVHRKNTDTQALILTNCYQPPPVEQQLIM